MKHVRLLLLLSLPSCAWSQGTVREYFDRHGEKSAPETSYYYTVGKKNDRGYYFDSLKSYFTSGDKIKSIEVRDQFGNRAGYCESFYSNGVLRARTRYDRKTFLPLEIPRDSSEFFILDFYDSLGHAMVTNGEGFVDGRIDFLWEKGKVVHGLRDSLWTIFHDNGKVYSYESWGGGHLIDGISYDESGREYYYQQFIVPPSPVGGLSDFYDELSSKINYPKDAARRGIEGKIVIEFSVERDGSITAPRVRKSLGFGCDEAALKALTSSPRWQPGKQRGQPVKHTMTIPFLFKLS